MHLEIDPLLRIRSGSDLLLVLKWEHGNKWGQKTKERAINKHNSQHNTQNSQDPGQLDYHRFCLLIWLIIRKKEGKLLVFATNCGWVILPIAGAYKFKTYVMRAASIHFKNTYRIVGHHYLITGNELITVFMMHTRVNTNFIPVLHLFVFCTQRSLIKISVNSGCKLC